MKYNRDEMRGDLQGAFCTTLALFKPSFPLSKGKKKHISDNCLISLELEWSIIIIHQKGEARQKKLDT